MENDIQERIKIAESLFGILPQTTTLEEALDEKYQNLSRSD